MDQEPTLGMAMEGVEAAGALTLDQTVEASTRILYRECLNEFLELSSKNDDESLAALKRNQVHQEILRKQLGRESELTTKRKQKIPNNIPILQLTGDVVIDKNKTVYETIDKFLSLFELVLYQHSLPVDLHWEAALISSIQHSVEYCNWFISNVKGKTLSWEQARTIIKTQYGGDHSQSLYLAKLNDMSMSKWEDPLRFMDRFMDAFRSAGVSDSVAFGSILLKAMEAQADLVKQIRTTYASTPVAGRSPLTVEYIASTLPHLHLDRTAHEEQGRRRRISGRHSNDNHVEEDRQGPGKSDSARNGHKDGNRQESRNSRRGRRRDRESAFGRRSGGDQEAKKRKDNDEQASKKGMCRFCHNEWFEGHRCKEYYQTKAAKTEYVSRVATLKKTQAGPSDFEKALQDIKITDEDELEEDECKSPSKQLRNQTKNQSKVLKHGSFIVPILIEHHQCYALLDSGATFSSLSVKFLSVNKIPLISSPGTIGLANNFEANRLGETKPLFVQYNQKEVRFVFEAMNMPDEQYQCVIGTDLFDKLGIFFIGLATSFDGPPTFAFDDQEYLDIPKPDDSPAGTETQQKAFHEAIQSSMQYNQAINPRSFCTVKESIISLPTPPGKTCFRRQYPIADKLMPVVDEAVKKWYTDGTIVRASINNEWNSPLTLAPKKNADGTKSKKRPCLDPRHLNLLLPDDRYPLPLIKEIFEQLKDARVFSTLDLKNAFHRFQIAPEDRHKTTFTHRGIQFMFRGCPFGLKPLSSKFQRVTALLLEDMPFATSFIDDIVVFSNNMTEHVSHVKQVMDVIFGNVETRE
jgi:hypothetical protein